jgi:hypothetical protein
LRFKPDNEDDRKFLYRVHLTYNTGIIDHRGGPHKKGVKELDANIKDQNDVKASLSDLFKNKKTVLLNITYNNKSLGAELKPGVYTDGIVVGEDQLSQYIKKNGG